MIFWSKSMEEIYYYIIYTSIIYTTVIEIIIRDKF